MDKKSVAVPKFHGESDEADWWASRAGRAYVRVKSAEARPAGIKVGGSALVAKLNRNRSAQIAREHPKLAGCKVKPPSN